MGRRECRLWNWLDLGIIPARPLSTPEQSFHVAAVTSDRKHGDSEQHACVSLAVLEAGNLKTGVSGLELRCWQGCLSPRSRGKSFQLGWLPASLACGRISLTFETGVIRPLLDPHAARSSVCAKPPLQHPLIGTPVAASTGPRRCWTISHLAILDLPTSAKPLFRSCLQVPRIRTGGSLWARGTLTASPLCASVGQDGGGEGSEGHWQNWV